MRPLIEDVSDFKQNADQVLTDLRITVSRAGLKEMAEWLRHEVSGYGPDTAVPEYRTWEAKVKGSIQAGALYMANDVDLTELLPPELAARATKYECREGIGAIEASLNVEGGTGEVRAALHGPILEAVNRGGNGVQLTPGHVCVEAHLSFSREHLRAIVTKVRQKAIDVCLECEDKGLSLPSPRGQTEETKREGPFWNAERRGVLAAIWKVLKEGIWVAEQAGPHIPDL